MPEALDLLVIHGSVRPHRQGIKAARFLVEACKARGHQTTLIDPLENQLPLLEKMSAPCGRRAGDLGEPQGNVDRRLTGWTRLCLDAQTDDLPDLKRAAAWLDENRPGEAGSALVHNDYKFDNLVLNPDDLTRIVAVLHRGDGHDRRPADGPGTTRSHWIEPDDPEPLRRFLVGPTTLLDCLCRRKIAESRRQTTGRDVSNMLYYDVFGLFKVVVIAQQIYTRFVRAATKHERFAVCGGVLAALGEQAVQPIEPGRY